MLLYDPLKFDIEEDDQIIIKTGVNGWFSDDTVKEVLEIANGRKILYISDIRVSDEDEYIREVNIFNGKFTLINQRPIKRSKLKRLAGPAQ